MKSLGICIGASTIKLAEVDEQGNVFRSIIQKHDCNPRKVLGELFQSVHPSDYNGITVTGRKFKELINLPAITEVEATELSLKYYLKGKQEQFNAILSLGSENFILYELDKRGVIVNIHTGNKCASGTGDFLLQQIRRMNISLDEAVALAAKSEPYRVSGRCSVFCKSDSTHALNKGVEIGRICAGLEDMIAAKIMELLKSVEKNNILLVGGVNNNTYVVNKLREKIQNLIIPEHAEIFEAVGAALYSFEHKKTLSGKVIIGEKKSSFGTLPKLIDAAHLVEFKEYTRGIARQADECILGLDVGSTTTKAVLIRKMDHSILASVYLRTNGNPVKASCECYKAIDSQLAGIDVKVIGLGVTGSGRQIAGLHALTEGIVNEIIAHAAGAAYFDKDVDTIIEIGGQDAKYTYLVNGVPCDYAMNEACSAGTGSFLEEAAKENLNVEYTDIQQIALEAEHPLNFNDQCAAFISSDIQNASHEHTGREDIIAGLVYSICMNYNNRVRGSRKIGEKIFMQGGVCYNRAVPLAMAALLKKKIIVPPEPGLIGAFGAALEIEGKINSGRMEKSEFSLKELAEREVEYGKNFVCPGTTEHCDLGCEINLIRIGGRNYPFGGICNKYYNMMHHLSIDPEPLDIVAKRQEMVFERNGQLSRKTIGISRSFHSHSMHPLYYSFFSRLGMKVVQADEVDPRGVELTGSSLCYPAEISHGMFKNLLDKNPDYVFLPHVEELYVEGDPPASKGHRCACILSQSEPYYLRSAFRDIAPKILSPVLDFSRGWESMEDKFIAIGKEVGETSNKAREAFRHAALKQKQFSRRKKQLGEQILKELDADDSKIGIVLFGRAYNAFSDEANMGIPRKFASRGVCVIPFDCLDYSGEDSIENMNWATGGEIIRCARMVKNHPRLFGAYITNFSCGPDSFLVGYFRDIMKTKPSLTLELDSHSADAGINTRIEAFLDIIQRYRSLGIKDIKNPDFTPARIESRNGAYQYISSLGEVVSIKDERVRMIIPSMGTTTTELVSAAFRGIGFKAESASPPDFGSLMLGRGNTSCKECLPLILTTASLLQSVEQRKNPRDMLLYFMPTAPGNCRFSQYYVFQKNLIEKKRLQNVALLTLTAENNYAGLHISDQLKILKSIVVADVLDDIKNALLVLPVDKAKAEEVFHNQVQCIEQCFENGGENLYAVLEIVSKELARIELHDKLSTAKKVLLAGEIYVRKDEFCSIEVIRKLAEKNIITKRSPVLEWLYYVDFVVKKDSDGSFNIGRWTESVIRSVLHRNVEKKVKSILAESGLYEYDLINMDAIIENGSKLIDPALSGEAIVVIGNFFTEMIKNVHGVISIGPFACMPARVIESILSRESKVAENKRLDGMENIISLRKFHTLPFLSIEEDGNPFPQIVEARIEAFALQVERIYRESAGVGVKLVSE
ncbi:MAG: acyl-CoA dehydratase activase [Bacteroidota bacterium]